MIKQFLLKQQAKGKLIQAFRSGGIHLTYKSGKNEHFIFPTIHHIGIDDNQLVYVFSIPLGLDPKDVNKKVWLFKQQFGKNVELDQENKRFTLTIYSKSIPKEFKYNYEKIKPYIEEMKLPIVGGIDLNGNIIVWDMADGKPHLLCAGENGSGKSAGVRQILTTLVQYKKPEELHLYLCDPKFTEFHLFEDIEHVQGKIAFEMKDIYSTIQTVKKELDKRKKLIGGKHKLTGIEKYNEKFKDSQLPYILLCIDEFAQLKKEKDAIELIETISAQGRAFGIFLLLATQRPDREVMNGLIKQNITVRMGYRHADIVNSRITNTIGAENISIEDKGRFILKMDVSKEIQAPFLSEEKAEKILKRYKGEPKPNEKQHKNIQTWTFPNVSENTNEQIKDDIEEVSPEQEKKIKLGLLG
ncbi:hypothetical protein BTR23_07550 [Alkalihalophilus pseudofirmus]|nr:hypothetical protein BTR23_07550 [Alkalihalophilus pseudofirmus]